MRRSTLAVSIAIATALLVTLSPPSSAIVGGRVDGTAHPYVGALFFPGSSFPICSGTLVRSKSRGVVFLTVSHCLVGYTKRRDVRVTFTPVVGTGKSFAGTFIPDPAFNPKAADPHDLAVVVFAHPPKISPAQLAPIGSLAATLPARFTTVGYGVTPGGVRQNAIERGTRVNGAWLFLRPVTGNSCYADSGGPDLRETSGTPVVAALTDQGPCVGRGSFDQDYRVDSAAAHWFIDHV
ncbi:MAG: hypothetical protein QOG53_3198 [Frankiales bacterium]|jgi:hypothetical protein|nr:hypothetical protein [Frankiales bacterium]